MICEGRRSQTATPDDLARIGSKGRQLHRCLSVPAGYAGGVGITALLTVHIRDRLRLAISRCGAVAGRGSPSPDRSHDLNLSPAVLSAVNRMS
jgi:hypothetical protein